MKFEEGDILVSRDTKIKIVGVSNKHYEYFYFDFVNPTIYTVCHHDIDDVCEYCHEYIRKKKIQKILKSDKL